MESSEPFFSIFFMLVNKCWLNINMKVPLNNMVPNTWFCYISWNSKIIQLHDWFERFQKKHIIDLKIHIFSQHICWPLVNNFRRLHIKIRIHISRIYKKINVFDHFDNFSQHLLTKCWPMPHVMLKILYSSRNSHRYLKNR